MVKKVLVNYIGKRGGGPVFAFEFAKGLAQNGLEVYAVVSQFVDNKKDWEECELLKDVYYVKTNELRGKKYYAKAQAEFMLLGRHKLKKHFESIHFEYVITTMQHMWSIDVSKLVNAKKIVWLCHDPIPHSGSGKIDTYLGNKFARIADEIVVLTKSFIPVVRDRWNIDEKHIHFMPHGRQNMYNRTVNEECLYYDNFVNFLFFGYLREYKGLRILARAYKKLSREYENVTLTIAGSGDFSKYEEEFEGLPGVTVYNQYIADSEVGKYFNGPNVVTVMPYLDATQSGVSLTAMEFGTVIIASDTGGLKEQLDEGKIGLYCMPGDEESLYKVMKHIVDHTEEFDRERNKMKAYLSNLEWNVVTGKLIGELDDEE